MEKHEQLRISAKSLLDSTKLVETLQDIGRVNLTGSYVYNLMVEPDIDIEVYCTDIHKAATQFSNEQITSGRWNGVMFYDWVNWRKEDFPVGYYVGFKQDFEGYRWKIDIWFLEEGTKVRNADSLMVNVTPEQRKLILEAKEAKLIEKWPVDSTAIYKAVIERNLETLAAIRTDLHLNGTAGY